MWTRGVFRVPLRASPDRLVEPLARSQGASCQPSWPGVLSAVQSALRAAALQNLPTSLVGVFFLPLDTFAKKPLLANT